MVIPKREPGVKIEQIVKIKKFKIIVSPDYYKVARNLVIKNNISIIIEILHFVAYLNGNLEEYQKGFSVIIGTEGSAYEAFLSKYGTNLPFPGSTADTLLDWSRNA